MIPLAQHAKVKHRICIYYPGQNPERFREIFEKREELEAQMPGSEIYFSLPDTLSYLVENHPRVIPSSQLPQLKYQFGLIWQTPPKVEKKQI